jgi:hypothetical protein
MAAHSSDAKRAVEQGSKGYFGPRTIWPERIAEVLSVVLGLPSSGSFESRK